MEDGYQELQSSAQLSITNTNISHNLQQPPPTQQVKIITKESQHRLIDQLMFFFRNYYIPNQTNTAKLTQDTSHARLDIHKRV